MCGATIELCNNLEGFVAHTYGISYAGYVISIAVVMLVIKYRMSVPFPDVEAAQFVKPLSRS